MSGRPGWDPVSSALVQLHAAASNEMAIPGAKHELMFLLRGIHELEPKEWFLDVLDEIVDAHGNHDALEKVQKRILAKYPFDTSKRDS
ncbi:MAG TPA: hypothetical protein VF647_09935 [Longimicrobium sp.]|jgi:hypothetical protein